MANQIFHFSNSGISSGQRFYLKDDVSGIFLNKLNVISDRSIQASNLVYNTGNQTISGVKTFIGDHIISGNVTITGANVTVNNTKVALSNQIFSAFPPGTGVRRYRPDGVLTLGIVAPPSGFIGYFPFIIKKLAINPKISVEVSTVVNPTPIRYGIYSGISGFQGARLFNSGSIDCPSVLGVYTSNISVNLPEGPYIIGTSNTGVASPHFFRAAGTSFASVMFGEPTGNSLFGSSNSHYYEAGSDLPTIIGSGFIAATTAGPIPFISY